MKRRHQLLTLRDAVEWLAQTWTPRNVPTRLHDHAFGDDGAPRFSLAFARHLTAKPDDMAPMTTTRTCNHLRLAGRDTWECPDCSGSGTFETTAMAYRYPMWRALTLLHAKDRDAHDTVITFVINSYSVDDMSEMGCTHDVLLTSIRKLHARYSVTPQDRPSWTDKSEAQQHAEMALAPA